MIFPCYIYVSAYLALKTIYETHLCVVRLCQSHSKGEHYDSEEASEIEHEAHYWEPTIRDKRAVLE